MADITTQQLAQLLLGIARAQNAFVEALENSKTGFRATHFRPAIESASRIRANRPDTLTDYPARLLLQMLARTGPDADTVQRDLERLLAASADTAATLAAAGPPQAARFAAGSATAPENTGGPVAGDDNSLDMTR
ncbi:MAG: hypothetical protein JWO70_5422 [Betaproteobacteria bacterium]|jgi:hypothetical protein|nr:hypothetical protein [Betaproteobacteria bacterium]